MPSDLLKELEIMAFMYQERGFVEKAEEIKALILELRSKAAFSELQAQQAGGEEAGK